MLLKQWPLGIPCSRGHPEQGKLGNVSSNPYETLRLSPIKGVRARKMLTQNSPYTLWQRLPGLRQLKTSPIPPPSLPPFSFVVEGFPLPIFSLALSYITPCRVQKHIQVPAAGPGWLKNGGERQEQGSECGGLTCSESA